MPTDTLTVVKVVTVRPAIRRTSWQRDLAWVVGLATFVAASVLVWSVTLWRASDDTRGPQALAVVVEHELTRVQTVPGAARLPAERPYERAVAAPPDQAPLALQQAATALIEDQGRDGWLDPAPWFSEAWVEHAVRPVVTSSLGGDVAPWWRDATLRVNAPAAEATAVGVREALPWNVSDTNPTVGAYRALIDRMVDAYVTSGRSAATEDITSVPLRVRVLQGLTDAERTLADLYMAAPNRLQDTVEAERQNRTRRAVLAGDTTSSTEGETAATSRWADGLAPQLARLAAEGLTVSPSTQLGAHIFSRAAHQTWQTTAVTSGLITLTGLVVLVLLGRGAGRLIRAGLPLTTAGIPGVWFAVHALLTPNAALPSWLPYLDVMSAARSWMLSLDGAAWEVAWVHAVLLAAGFVLLMAGTAVWLRGSGRPG